MISESPFFSGKGNGNYQVQTMQKSQLMAGTAQHMLAGQEQTHLSNWASYSSCLPLSYGLQHHGTAVRATWKKGKRHREKKPQRTLTLRLLEGTEVISENETFAFLELTINLRRIPKDLWDRKWGIRKQRTSFHGLI